MENNFQRIILTGDKKIIEAKYDCIEILYTNGREDLIDTYIKNTRECIQRDRGLSIPNCPIKVDFEIGPSWGELNEV